MFIDARLGGVHRFYHRAPRDGMMQVPNEIRQCVVFLGTPGSSDDEIILRCTAVLVAMQISPGSDTLSVYVVTVKHHADKIEGKKFGIRLNTKDGRAKPLWIDEDRKWYRHPTEPNSVDLAVLPLGTLDSIYEFRVIPREMFLTDDIIKNAYIGAGDEIFMTGLFMRLKGTRNTPVVRTGNVAAIPEDRVTINLSGTMVESEVYLIEARSMGGISGSPIFVREAVSTQVNRDSEWKKGEQITTTSPGPFYFMGLMHGHWTIRPQEQNRNDWMASGPTEDESIALGIAVVVPAKKILEILDQPELVQLRRGHWQIAMSQFGTVSE
jgi:hypothetical protein